MRCTCSSTLVVGHAGACCMLVQSVGGLVLSVTSMLGLAGELGGVAALRVDRLLFCHELQRCTALGHDLLECLFEVLIQVDERLLESPTFLMVQVRKEELDAILGSHQAI